MHQPKGWSDQISNRYTLTMFSSSAARYPRPKKAAVILANTLLKIIFSADHHVGDHLPTEAELLEEFSVGRGTLREAMRLLEAQELISIGQGRNGGAVITMPGYDSLADYMANAYCARGATIGELLSARAGIEPAVAHAAALSRTDDDLAALRQSVSRMSAASDEVFLEENSSFHQLVAEATHNPVYLIVVSSLKTVHDGHALGVGFSRRSLAAAQHRHENILKSLDKGDAESAQAEMLDHMKEFYDFVRTRYPHVLNLRITPLLSR
jgi:GntR family transcriptional regulator, transcriptional repressor for pyruvate dehydrogenase complex